MPKHFKVIGLCIFLYCHQMYCTQELPLLISVCTYNASPWVEKNLDSIFSQEYDNFHVIYIDDASSDDTATKVQQYIDTHNVHNNITLIVNKTRERKMKNIYNSFHSVPDDVIIVQVDGDDWLAHKKVFSHINKLYTENNIWLTYGQFQIYPSNELGLCQAVPQSIITERSYRQYKWVYTHLRTFYAWLFKCIKLQDFIAEEIPEYNGKFFPVSNDNASYFPMLEMCADKFLFVPEILYIHNHSNPNYGRSIEIDLFNHARRDIRSRPKYPIVKQPVMHRLSLFENAQADALILSYNNPRGLKKLLKSMLTHAQGLDTITVLYQSIDTETQELYQMLKQKYLTTTFVPITRTTVSNTLLTILENTQHPYILVAQDHVHLINTLDLQNCIVEMERTFAYGFYFNFAQNKEPFFSYKNQKEYIPSQLIDNNICTWKFNCGKYALYNNIDMTLVRKKDLIRCLNNMPSIPTSLIDFLNAWKQNTHVDGHMIGLFFQKPIVQGKPSTILTPAIKKPKKIPKQLIYVHQSHAPKKSTHKRKKWLADFYDKHCS